MALVSKCNAILGGFDFDQYGYAALERPLSIDIYRQWLDKGFQAGMKYLETHEPLKAEPSRFAPKARAAIVITKRYFPHPYSTPAPQRALRTALYALGEDYHLHFQQELEATAKALKEEFPEHEFLCCADSAPVLERDLAYRAGLGWFGKNTCLIHPQKGSLFFIGEILTSLPLSSVSETVPDLCGTCDRCLRACPTQALEEPRQLNANKCIAYWTIEAREAAPTELRERFGDWFFGCDICQTVCPWNEKNFGREEMRAHSSDRMDTHSSALIEDLRWILKSSRNELGRVFARSPISRARPAGLKRNALVVIGNSRLRELRPEVENCLQSEDLRELAEWALEKL